MTTEELIKQKAREYFERFTTAVVELAMQTKRASVFAKNRLVCVMGRHEVDPDTETNFEKSEGEISADGRTASWSSDWATWETWIRGECLHCGKMMERRA